jgi:hypothetical protein
MILFSKMDYINNDVINWINGKKYSKLKKNKINNQIEYNEITKNYKSNSRKQWSNKYGEELVKFLLKNLGYKIKEKRKIYIDNKYYEIDIETEEHLYEVKTRNWTTTGTAGEKILGVSLKYSEIPRITNKKLYIVLVAYQEYEAVNSFNIFKNNDNNINKKKLLNKINEINIFYLKCSDLLNQYLYKQMLNEIKNIKIID